MNLIVTRVRLTRRRLAPVTTVHRRANTFVVTLERWRPAGWPGGVPPP